MISDLSSGFQVVKNGGGLKKASLYVHFEGLTTDSYFSTRPPGWRLNRKKAFFNTSDEKTWFLTCPVVFKWSERGVKNFYVHFKAMWNLVTFEAVSWKKSFVMTYK